MLTGIHLSSYGLEWKDENGKQTEGLLDLIRAVHGVEGIKRIRLGSLEPRIVTEEFAKELACLPKICPHFHLSLQSGCDATLKRMNADMMRQNIGKNVSFSGSILKIRH